MRLEVFAFLRSEKKTSTIKVYECRNWPNVFPQKGQRLTLAIWNRDEKEEKQKEVEIIHDESEEKHGKIWVDMGEFTQGLQNGLYKVMRWTVAPNTVLL